MVKTQIRLLHQEKSDLCLDFFAVPSLHSLKPPEGGLEMIDSWQGIHVSIFRPPDMRAYWKIIFFISRPNICCGYSKEPSQ